MDHYIVSARKYRPSTFNTVIGQKPLTAALKHAVATDRLAHAYLFCGSRGVGKTSCARIFAKTINCEHRTADGEACNQCESCKAFNNGSSFNIIELDAASHNGIDDIKGLTEQVMVPPTTGRYRVFIIDEVHMLSAAAFNAFLKTLEEPPEYVIFILATTEKHKIIPTILSRCQIYDFSRITIQDMVEHLANVAANEGIKAEPAALNVIAQKADGAMRDALSIFDQVAASTMGDVSYSNTIENLNILDHTYYSRLISAFLSGDVPSALLIYQEIRDKGFDSQFFINGLGLYMRDLMVAMNPATMSLLEASDEVKAQMAQVARGCSPQFIYAAMDLCNTADLNYRAATNKQFLVELTLVKLCQLTAPKTVAPSDAQPLKPVTPAQPSAPTQPSAPAAPVRPAQPTTASAQPANNSAAPHAAPPSVQAPPQPRYAPMPNVAKPPVQPTRKAASNLPSFSISGTAKKEESAPSAPSESEDESHRRASAYTLDQLNKAWKDYIEAHPTERILINTMKAAIPKQVENDRFVIEVDDAIQVDTVNNFKAEILSHLHEQLKNDNIMFSIEMRQGESSPSTWTQREVLQHMIEKYPALREMISDFSLTI